MIVFSARIESDAANRRELLQALLTWVASARAAPGAASVHLSEDLETPGVYSLSSSWHGRRDFEAHVSGPQFGILLGAVEVLGLRMALGLTRAEESSDEPVEIIRRVRGRIPPLGDSRASRGGAVVGTPDSGGPR